MVDAADWNRVLVTDLAVERARLRKSDVMRFGGRAAAYDAGLRRDEFAVLLVAQTNRLRRNAAASDNCRCRSRHLGDVGSSALLGRRFVARTVDSLPQRSAWLSSLNRSE